MRQYGRPSYYYVNVKRFLDRLLAGLSFLLRRKGIVVQKELSSAFIKLSLKPKELEWLLHQKLQLFLQELTQGHILKINCFVEGEHWLLSIYSNGNVDSTALLDGLLAHRGVKLEVLNIPDWGTELLISVPCRTLKSAHERAL